MATVYVNGRDAPLPERKRAWRITRRRRCAVGHSAPRALRRRPSIARCDARATIFWRALVRNRRSAAQRLLTRVCRVDRTAQRASDRSQS
jgi:hypothetical protein